MALTTEGLTADRLAGHRPRVRDRKAARALWIEIGNPEDVAAWEGGGQQIARRNLIFSIVSEHIGWRKRRSASRMISLVVVSSAVARASTAARSSGSRRTGTTSAGPEPIGGRPPRGRSVVTDRRAPLRDVGRGDHRSDSMSALTRMFQRSLNGPACRPAAASGVGLRRAWATSSSGARSDLHAPWRH